MCAEHTDNASDILKNWLQAQRIKFTTNVIVANVGTDENYYDYMKTELAMGSRSDKKLSKQPSRDSLQSGEAAKMMDNGQILDFFSSDMKRMQIDSKDDPDL